MVLGDPGTGKTALLTEVLDAASQDMRVLQTQGIESEAPLAFAALQRLLRPLMSLAGDLPARQAKALRVAFGMEAGEGDGDRFLVFLAALSLLAEAADTQPVLVVVDDAHWLDDASAAALLFVARRIEVERVAMLFAAREMDVRTFDFGDLPILRLAGLDLAASTGLLRERTDSDVSPEVAAQLLASTRGNPLALVEMPQVLSSDQLAGRSGLPGHLPVTATIERVFLDRARRLSPGAQQLLLVAAADDSMQLATVEVAAAAMGAGPDALAEAERSGLVQITGSTVEMRHPLVRSALYAAATSVDRREVHAALADALLGPDDADRRAWHRAASRGPARCRRGRRPRSRCRPRRATRRTRGGGSGLGARSRAQPGRRKSATPVQCGAERLARRPARARSRSRRRGSRSRRGPAAARGRHPAARPGRVEHRIGEGGPPDAPRGGARRRGPRRGSGP